MIKKILGISIAYCCVLTFASIDSAVAEESQSGLTTFLKISPLNTDANEVLSKSDLFNISDDRLVITGPQNTKSAGQWLFNLIKEQETFFSNEFGFDASNIKIVVHLYDRQESRAIRNSLLIDSGSKNTLVLPFPVNSALQKNDYKIDFSVFSLLHSISKADVAFGSPNRVAFSSHAYRFVDGLSGYFSLRFIRNIDSLEANDILAFLHQRDRNIELNNAFDSSQYLAQNVSSEEIGTFSGLGQFFSGVRLTRDEKLVDELRSFSTSAERINIFRYVERVYGKETIRSLVGLLAHNSVRWDLKGATSKMRCRQSQSTRCRIQLIDGTRSDILLEKSTGFKFAELLEKSKSEFPVKKASFPDPTPNYVFDFPQAGGINKGFFRLGLNYQLTNINTEDLAENQSIPTQGFEFNAGVKDEAFKIQLDFRYDVGTKSTQEDITYASTKYEVDKTLNYNDLLIGSRLVERGMHSGVARELGVYFHWKRIQIEWNTRNVPTANDLEFVNRGYFMLDIQNYSAIKPVQSIDLGFNYNFQIGLVNHSGSTKTAAEEKYNKDISNLILGANLGPEFRFNWSAINLGFVLGSSFHYLWQPADDEGGNQSGNNTLNATQGFVQSYANLSFEF